MLIGTHGNRPLTKASIGELNIAFLQRSSFGASVNPAKNTRMHTIKTPLTKPKTAPSKRLSQPNPILLKIVEIAMPSRLDTNNVAKNSTKNAAKICSDSVGILSGIIGVT